MVMRPSTDGVHIRIVATLTGSTIHSTTHITGDLDSACPLVSGHTGTTTEGMDTDIRRLDSGLLCTATDMAIPRTATDITPGVQAIMVRTTMVPTGITTASGWRETIHQGVQPYLGVH